MFNQFFVFIQIVMEIINNFAKTIKHVTDLSLSLSLPVMHRTSLVSIVVHDNTHLS